MIILCFLSSVSLKGKHDIEPCLILWYSQHLFKSPQQYKRLDQQTITQMFVIQIREKLCCQTVGPHSGKQLGSWWRKDAGGGGLLSAVFEKNGSTHAVLMQPSRKA